MVSLFDWSATPASNTAVNGVNVAEGMSPALVNDAIRSVMALVRNSFATGLQNFLAGSAGLGLANGGTGGTDAATALAALGALASTYRDLPAQDQNAAFTFADAMRGCSINYTGAAAAATINPNATTAIGVRGVIVVRNNGSGALTITRGAGVTLKENGSTTSADAILAVGGVATLIKWATDDWTVTGSGLS